jgi:Family of unknown function (DUF6220)
MTQTTPSSSTNAVPGGLRRQALLAGYWLFTAFLAIGVVQIFLAGLGIFALDGRKLGAAGETAFDPHRTAAMVLTVVALLALVAIGIARPGARLIVLAVVLLVLTAVVQSVLASVGEDTPFFGGLHALDGLAVLGLAAYLRKATSPGGVAGGGNRSDQ